MITEIGNLAAKAIIGLAIIGLEIAYLRLFKMVFVEDIMGSGTPKKTAYILLIYLLWATLATPMVCYYIFFSPTSDSLLTILGLISLKAALLRVAIEFVIPKTKKRSLKNSLVTDLL